jgi:hypothetical protein
MSNRSFENKITASNIDVGDFYTTEAHFLPDLLFVLSSDVAMLFQADFVELLDSGGLHLDV